MLFYYSGLEICFVKAGVFIEWHFVLAWNPRLNKAGQALRCMSGSLLCKAKSRRPQQDKDVHESSYLPIELFKDNLLKEKINSLTDNAEFLVD